MNRSSRWSRCQTSGKKCVKAERRTAGPALSWRGKGVRNSLSVEGGRSCFKTGLMEGGGVVRGGGYMRIQKTLFSEASRRQEEEGGGSGSIRTVI